MTASTGDNGYQGGSFPASSQYVTAVGGTTLTSASNTRGWNESAWSGAGSGCSTVNPALAAAASSGTGCAKRAIADVSAAADPSNGGMAVYYPTSAKASTWAQVGGTSESAPIIASVYALSGNTAGYANAIPYSHTANLFDVTSGSNGVVPDHPVVHRPHRLGRPDRARHAERHRGLLTPQQHSRTTTRHHADVTRRQRGAFWCHDGVDMTSLWCQSGAHGHHPLRREPPARPRRRRRGRRRRRPRPPPSGSPSRSTRRSGWR